jgi:ATP-dependent DNA ligase
VAFVDGDDVYLQSRNGKALRRYFPELRFPKGRYVLDGEIVIFGENGVQLFDALGQRIHPAKTRIDMLAEQTPRGSSRSTSSPAATTCSSTCRSSSAGPSSSAPSTPRRPHAVEPRPADAEPWLRGAEGVIAKELAAPYRPGERTGMVKIKRVRTIDAVVRGWRPGKEEGTVGSLILALYGDDGNLREVGHTSGFTAKEKRALVDRLAPYETGVRGTGEPSRWANDRELEWRELRPELVVEVTVRPRERRPHPPRREDPALARGQGPARVPARPARQLT